MSARRVTGDRVTPHRRKQQCPAGVCTRWMRLRLQGMKVMIVRCPRLLWIVGQGSRLLVMLSPGRINPGPLQPRPLDVPAMSHKHLNLRLCQLNFCHNLHLRAPLVLQHRMCCEPEERL